MAEAERGRVEEGGDWGKRGCKLLKEWKCFLDHEWRELIVGIPKVIFYMLYRWSKSNTRALSYCYSSKSDLWKRFFKETSIRNIFGG